MRSLTLAAIILLAGCATSGEDPKASYFLISTGEASLIYSLFMGGVSYCKISQGNLGSTEFIVDMKYDGEDCRVEASATDE